jgi:hypothetical protein
MKKMEKGWRGPCNCTNYVKITESALAFHPSATKAAVYL